MAKPDEKEKLNVADQLHSASIHLLRHARKSDVLSGQGPARLSALSVLVFAGPMTLGQLAAAEQVKPPTMSRIVAGLSRAGLARVESDESDARRILIRTTARGERLLQQARERRIQAVAQLLDHLSEQEIDVVREGAQLLERAIRGTRNS